MKTENNIFQYSKTNQETTSRMYLQQVEDLHNTYSNLD